MLHRFVMMPTTATGMERRRGDGLPAYLPKPVTRNSFDCLWRDGRGGAVGPGTGPLVDADTRGGAQQPLEDPGPEDTR